MSTSSTSSYASFSSMRRNQSRSLQRLQATFEKHRAKPLPSVFKSRIDGPSPAWKVFKRLQMATAYADVSTKDCMVFSYEGRLDNNGQRLFLVAHPNHLWLNYKNRPLEDRCSYEVIRENYPCKLYFDLEYYTCYNPRRDGNLMTQIFLKCVIAAMFEYHRIMITESDFLWLDASNKQKYSCHLILLMKDIAFRNNIHAGIFVSTLLSTLRIKVDNNAPAVGLWPSANEIKNLLVETKNKNQVFFCDEGVYTKNRNFRMYLSTKPGKDSPLRLSPLNQYKPITERYTDEDEAMFYDSLITYFRDQKITRFLNYDDMNSSDICSSFSKSFLSRTQSRKPGVSGCSSSPFPNLDEFISGIIKDSVAIGFIRKWTYLSNEQKIIYDIGNFRFCLNIGRHHKSNNIKIIVDMEAKCYYQTCLDPECRLQRFVSKAFAIPDDISILNVPDDFFDVCCFSQLSEEDNKVENQCITSNGSKEIFCLVKDDLDHVLEDKLDQELTSDFENFTELDDMYDQVENIENNVIATSNFETFSRQGDIHNSWDNFFSDDFSCTPPENVNKEKTKSLPVDFNSLCDFGDDFWNAESASDDSEKVLLGNVSIEEEMLMAQAAEVTEATIDQNMICEETMF